MIEKRRRDVEKLKRGESLTSTGRELKDKDLLRMSRELSKLPEAERDMVIRNYALLKSTEGGSAAAPYLPLLVGFAKANPGASDSQMISYLKLMDGQLLKGLELAKAMNPNPAKADANAMQFLTLMKDLIVEGVRNPLLQALKEIQPQVGVFEQILTRPELWNRAKEIGMFGGSNVATSNLDLEIEKLRGERQLTVTKLELEMRRDELKRQAEDRRTDTIISVFAPLASAFAGSAAAGKMRDLGQQQAAAHNPTQANLMSPSKMAPQENLIRILCRCGYEGTQPLTDPPQKEVRCPKCEQMLTFIPTEMSSTEEPVGE